MHLVTICRTWTPDRSWITSDSALREINEGVSTYPMWEGALHQAGQHRQKRTRYKGRARVVLPKEPKLGAPALSQHSIERHMVVSLLILILHSSTWLGLGTLL